ncbi:MAG: TIGR01548 family HAD-type hydrolase [Planctomycetes bacterium]|nr:TIGR01548 family HAD-type hydrolase [Planctomycetota bacterium]
MSAYRVASALAPTDLKLAGNEGIGPDPALLQELVAEGTEVLRCYPSNTALQRAIARWLELDPEQVLLTAGGDEGLDRICRWALRQGGHAILPWPGFEMTRRYLDLTTAEVERVAWTEHRLPIEAMLAAVRPETRLVVVTSPNNPTGGTATAEDLQRLREAAPQAVLLVDLAYAEFAKADLTAAALSLPRTIVVRTFSKAWGLAGCRVGYLLGQPEDIAALAAVGGPYPVAGPSLALAQKRLAEGQATMRAAVAATRLRRDQLFAQLQVLGWKPRPSEANFVCCEPPDPLEARDRLAGMGIAVRAWPDQQGLQSLLRIGCPTDDAGQQRLLRALRIVAQPEALLFDMDGVLADVSQSYRRCVIETARSYGVQVDTETIQAAKERGGLNNDWVLTQALLAEQGIERSLEEVTQRFEEIYQGSPEAPGLRRTESLIGGAETRARLQRLAARFPLAIVTGRPRADALRFLREEQIADAFRCVVALEDAPNKPQPDPLLRARDELGVERAWMIGDTVDDITAARAAGCLPIGFRAPAEALLRAGAACVLNCLSEVEARLT